jgi:hypothetical protein
LSQRAYEFLRELTPPALPALFEQARALQKTHTDLIEQIQDREPSVEDAGRSQQRRHRQSWPYAARQARAIEVKREKDNDRVCAAAMIPPTERILTGSLKVITMIAGMSTPITTM